MQTPDSESTNSAVPLYDVVISMPPGARLETIQKLAETEAGLPPDRVERLIKVLRTTPNAKVGAAVTLERAEEEKVRFTKAGLHTEIIALQIEGDSRAVKVTQHEKLPPALDNNQPVVVAENNSGPYSNDLTPGHADAAPEKKDKSLNSSFFQGKTGLLIGSALAIAIGLFYATENKLTIGGISLPWSKKDTAPNAIGASFKQMSVSGDRSTGATAIAELLDDPDSDDLLIQAINGNRVGAKGLTIEEALAAATGRASAEDAVTRQTRQILTTEFALALAELGHSARAREVLKALAGNNNPAADAQAASALQAAQLKLIAWSVLRTDDSQSKALIEQLKIKTQAIVNAQERTLLQGQIADILNRNTHLAGATPRVFLSLAGESLKLVSDKQSPVAAGLLAVSTGEVFLRETTARAKLGAWSKAKASANQVDDLIKRTPDAWTQARLLALDHQARQLMGQHEKASKSLESALALAGKNSNLLERAVWLRSIARLSDAGTNEQFEAAANSLQDQLNARPGMEKAQGLTELSLLYTEAGLPGKSAKLRRQAQETSGLNASDSAAVNTDLIVRGDIATAKMLHGQGRYAEAEVVLQRLGGYLF